MSLGAKSKKLLDTAHQKNGRGRKLFDRPRLSGSKKSSQDNNSNQSIISSVTNIGEISHLSELTVIGQEDRQHVADLISKQYSQFSKDCKSKYDRLSNRVDDYENESKADCLENDEISPRVTNVKSYASAIEKPKKINVVLEQSILFELIDIPSLLPEATDCDTLQSKRETDWRSWGTNTGNIEDNLHSVGIQTLEIKLKEENIQCSNWEIYDAKFTFTDSDAGLLKTLNSCVRMERAVSWNSFGRDLQKLKESRSSIGSQAGFKFLLPSTKDPFENNDDRYVTSMAWHPHLPEVLAVGFSIRNKEGLVHCWTLKNCSRPEHEFKLNRPVAKLYFCRIVSSILVIETAGVGSGLIYTAGLCTPKQDWITSLAPPPAQEDNQPFPLTPLPVSAGYHVASNGTPIKWASDNYAFGKCLYFSPDESLCLYGLRSGPIQLFSTLNPETRPIKTFNFHTGPVSCLSWGSPDNNTTDVNLTVNLFASCSLDTTTSVWNILQPQRPLVVLHTVPCRPLMSCSFNTTLPCRLACLSDSIVFVWTFPGNFFKVAHREDLHPLNFNLSNPIQNALFTSLALTFDGGQLSVGMDNGNVLLYNLNQYTGK